MDADKAAAGVLDVRAKRRELGCRVIQERARRVQEDDGGVGLEASGRREHGRVFRGGDVEVRLQSLDPRSDGGGVAVACCLAEDKDGDLL